MLPYQPDRSLFNNLYARKDEAKRLHIAFVDPLASATFLGEQLREAGIETSAIYTVVDNHDGHQQQEIFDHYFYVKNQNDLTNIVPYLQQIGVSRIYYGSDHSIQIADILANIISPNFANNLANSINRSDQFILQKVLEQNHYPTIKQIKLNQLGFSEIEPQLTDFRFPVLNKPLNHFNSLGLKVCHDIDDVKSTLEQEPNIFSHFSNGHIIQEFSAGTEFFIDTFSENGVHHISGIQRFRRRLLNQKPIYLYSDVVSLETNEAKICKTYVKQILDLADVKNGFSHTEVLLSDGGPKLLAMNPRLSGASGLNNKLFKICGFPSQVDLLIAAAKSETMPQPKQIYSGRKVYLQTYEERIINKLDLPLLYTLSSFQEALMLKRPGSLVGAPQTPTDCVGLVLLVNRNPRQLEMDYQQIMEWEKNKQLF